MGKISNFIKESRQEFAKVNWPTGKEAVKMVFMVIGICLIVSLFLGAVDYGFVTLIRYIVS